MTGHRPFSELSDKLRRRLADRDAERQRIYVCPDHVRMGGYESCCDCGGWEADDPDRGRPCTEAGSP